MSYLKVWGCEVYVKQQANDKLSAKSLKCLFVGYPKETRGYYVYCPFDNKVFVVRSGFFLEKDLVSKRNSGSKVDLEEVHKAHQRRRQKLKKYHKTLWKLLQKHKDHEGLIGHVFGQRDITDLS